MLSQAGESGPIFTDWIASSLVGCACGCGKPVVHHGRFASDACRWRARERTPERLAYTRARMQALRSPQPWLRGAPIFGTHLPGGGVVIDVSKSVEHRHVVALHGLVTSILDHGHGQEPDFSLVPYPSRSGWAVYTPHEEDLAKLASLDRPGRIYETPVVIRTSQPWRLRAPDVAKRGRRRLAISTITPVVIRSMASKVARDRPTGESIAHSLSQTLARRLGLSCAPPVDVVTDETASETTWLTGKLKAIVGWHGRVVVETSAEGEWLIRCAALGMGLGGRTAYGFGRIRAEAA